MLQQLLKSAGRAEQKRLCFLVSHFFVFGVGFVSLCAGLYTPRPLMPFFPPFQKVVAATYPHLICQTTYDLFAMVSFQTTLTIFVYISFILYGLHNQSQLLSRHMAHLDELHEHGRKDEIISLPEQNYTQQKDSTNTTINIIRLRKSPSTRTSLQNDTMVQISKKYHFSERTNLQYAKKPKDKITYVSKTRLTNRDNTWSTQPTVYNHKTNTTSIIPTFRLLHHHTHPNASSNNYHDSNDNTTTTTTVSPPYSPYRKWAYAFLVGGCSIQHKPQYRGFIYNVAVAARSLRDLGSTADFVVFIQMSHTTKDKELPKEDTALLQMAGVRIIYLPKFVSSVHERFYSLVMEKFRILQLTEYSRVLFMDSDIMPLCSLDYLFELSEPPMIIGDNIDGVGEVQPLLKENVVLAWRKEPANAGLFMLTPDPNDYSTIQEVIVEKEKKAMSLPWPHWDPVEGWGHKIEAWDAWKTPDGINGTDWTWHASFADQGLLYYWTKYVKKNVSLIIKDKVENWGSSGNISNKNSTAILEDTYHNLLNYYTCKPISRERPTGKNSPYRDIKHFTGRGKPWQKNESSVFDSMLSQEGEPALTVEKWFRILKTVSQEANIQLNFSFAIESDNSNNAPPVGRFSDFGTMIKHIWAKQERNWDAYEK